jgi:hypothetical protein
MVVRKLQFLNNFRLKTQNTEYFARFVRQLTELPNKSVIHHFGFFCLCSEKAKPPQSKSPEQYNANGSIQNPCFHSPSNF